MDIVHLLHSSRRTTLQTFYCDRSEIVIQLWHAMAPLEHHSHSLFALQVIQLEMDLYGASRTKYENDVPVVP